MRQQIINLMAAGLSKKVILDSLDISEDYLKEVLGDSDFTKDALKARAEVADDRIDTKYARTEEKLLDKVVENLDIIGDMTTTLKALEVVNKARISRRMPVQSAGHFSNPTVGINITLPNFLIPNAGTPAVLMDSNKQVVAIEGRNMAPMPIPQVQKLFKEFDKTEKSALQKDLSGEYYDPIIEEHKRSTLEEAA